MALVIFTASVGMFLAPGELHLLKAVLSLLSLSIGAGAAGALNMWVERDSDALMKRTQSRPLPTGRVRPAEAASLGVTCSIFSVLMMSLASGLVPAFWLGFTIVFYVVVYTLWLKPRTPQNIVIGGVAGALPPVIGWASITGTTPLEAWALFLIIFMWTPPHFWALSLWCAQDYERAQIPMLPNVVGAHKTRVQIFIYGLAVMATVYVPYLLGTVGNVYLVLALLLNLPWLQSLYRVLRRENVADQKRLFFVSILYLFGIFCSLILDRLAGGLLNV